MGSARGDGSRGGEFASAAAFAKALGRPAAFDEDEVADVGEDTHAKTSVTGLST
ncbi:hypothetical protein ACGFLS_01390 [Streptomyces abikoensis]|uniref:hypothetical protein n=1 Tax=Streptomyces abikoensis TaxID=97398 RepID=UPI00371E7C00